MSNACYAALLSDCVGGITKEHYFSRQILEQIVVDSVSGPAMYGGMPWITQKTPRPLSVSSLSAKVLCRKHNNDLSCYDSEMGKLFQVWTAYDRGITKDTAVSEVTEIDGPGIAMWMLKAACGIVASRMTGRNDVRRKSNIVADEFVDVLFRKKPWPESWTLHLVQSEKIYINNGFTFTLVEDAETEEVLGARICLSGLTLFLSFRCHVGDEGLHPKAITLQRADIEKTLVFRWPSSPNIHYRFTWSGTYDGTPPWPGLD